MRRAARQDENHHPIADAFRQCGCDVLDLSGVGRGCPDLLVVRAAGNRHALVECKDGAKEPRKRRLTPAQQAFWLQWRGPLVKVESVDEALALVKSWGVA